MIKMRLSRSEFVSLITYLYRKQFSREARENLALYFEQKQKHQHMDPITLCDEVNMWIEIHSQYELTRYIAASGMSKRDFLRKEKIQLTSEHNILLRAYDYPPSKRLDYDDIDTFGKEHLNKTKVSS